MLRPDEEDQLSGTPLPWWLRVPGGSFNISFPTFVVSVDNIRYLSELHRNRKSPAPQILDLLTELMFWLKASQHLEFYDSTIFRRAGRHVPDKHQDADAEDVGGEELD